MADAAERVNVPGVLRMLEAEGAAPFSPRMLIEMVARLIRQQQGETEQFGAEVQRLKRALGEQP